MTVIGFTGTRSGMTDLQRDTLMGILCTHIESFHHGDCKGADEQAHEIAETCGLEIYIHPPTNPTQRAFCSTHPSRMFQERPYLERNAEIVLKTELLIATPAEPLEQLRSGTWSTVRYARKIGRSVVIILPDGIKR